jgi:hypothetical protein
VHSPAAAAAIRELAKTGVSWAHFLSLVFKNEVTPSVYRSLCAHARGEIPPDVLQSLKSECQRITASNFLLGSELLSVLNTLSAQNIPAMPVKGPTLGISVYGQLSGRQFGDLDILVESQLVNQAKDLLHAAGYEPFSEEPPRAGPQSSVGDKHWVLKHKVTGVIVELHWALLRPILRFRLEPAALWESAGFMTLLGEQVPCLSAENQFLLLAAHGGGHGWDTLKWICDVAELVRVHSGPGHTELDWLAVLNRARTLGCLKIALLALALAAEFLDAPVPDSVLRQIHAEPRLQTWVADIRRKIFLIDPEGGKDPSQQILEGAAHSRFLMETRDRLTDRLILLQGAILDRVRPNVWDAGFAELPHRLSFLQWILRPVRLAKLYGLRAFTLPSRLLFRGLFG